MQEPTEDVRLKYPRFIASGRIYVDDYFSQYAGCSFWSFGGFLRSISALTLAGVDLYQSISCC